MLIIVKCPHFILPIQLQSMSTYSRKPTRQQHQHERPHSQQPDFNRSELSIVSNPIKKTYLSESLKKSIAQTVNQRHSQRPATKPVEGEETLLTKLVRNKIKDLRRLTVCDICNTSFKKTEFYLCECPHKYNFCQPCLYIYAMYKIKQFQEVYCPSQNCGAVINTETDFFKKMPINLQNNYHKIHRFTIAAKDSTVIKLCPNQKCEGMLRLKPDKDLICDTCNKQYCTKCFLAKHEGDCQQFQLNYFQNDLHYRQCTRCKMIVQRNKGCNHMTCKCLYQFCYICGQKWSTIHSKMHQQHPQQPHPQARIHQHSLMLQLVECCICNGCHQGQCLNFWNSYIGLIVKFMAKFIMLLLQAIWVLIQLVFRDFPFLIWIFICTILIGVMFTSIQVICESNCVQSLLLLLFFPVAMLWGVYRSFGEVFNPAMHEFYNGSISPIIDSFDDIISF